MQDITTPDRYYIPARCPDCGYQPNNRADEVSHYTDPTACDMSLTNLQSMRYDIGIMFIFGHVTECDWSYQTQIIDAYIGRIIMHPTIPVRA